MSSNPYRFGWVRDKLDHRDLKYCSMGAPSAIPDVIDLRPSCPDVYNQGRLGSCTANAIAFAHEFEQRNQGMHIFMPSRLFIYYNERALEGTTGFDSGASIRDGFKSIGRLGVCPETDWPYTIAKFATKPDPACYTHALKHQALKYRRVAQDETSILQCLDEGYPIVFGFAVYESFMSETTKKTGQVHLPGPAEDKIGDHAVALTGSFRRNRIGIVRNSWGSGWGDNGYCYMPFDYFLDPEYAADFWTLRLVEMDEKQ